MEHRAALITYLMAGDPDLRRTYALALACEAGGADILELGIPSSDPIADGPEIQEAGQRALRGGTRPSDVLSLAASLRTRTEIPLVVMTYLNPVLVWGVKAFAERNADAGVDGVIIPDLSTQISDELRDALDGSGVDHVRLVAPATPADRAEAIARASRHEPSLGRGIRGVDAGQGPWPRFLVGRRDRRWERDCPLRRREPGSGLRAGLRGGFCRRALPGGGSISGCSRQQPVTYMRRLEPASGCGVCQSAGPASGPRRCSRASPRGGAPSASRESWNSRSEAPLCFANQSARSFLIISFPRV